MPATVSNHDCHLAPPPPISREFRIGGQFRRCSLYVVAGMAFCGGLVLLLPRPNAGRPLGEQLAVITVLAVLALAFWAYLQTWRLRIDDVGVWRRRLGFWTCWPWEAFDSGRVIEQEDGKIIRRDQPLWDRWLLVEYLPDADRKFVRLLLRKVLQNATALEQESAEPPAESVRVGLMFRGALEITRERVRFTGCRRQREFAWADIEHLRIVRKVQSGEPTFSVELKLRNERAIRGAVNRLDGKRLTRQTKQQPTWLKALGRIVPPPQWQCYRLCGELSSRAEGEFRIAHHRELIAFARWLGPGGALILGTFSLWPFIRGIGPMIQAPFMPLGWKIVAIGCGLLTAGMPSFLVWIQWRYISRQSRQAIVEIEAEMVQLDAMLQTPKSAA